MKTYGVKGEIYSGKRKAVKGVLLTILGLIVALVLVVVGYVIYVFSSYYRIGDIDLEVKSNAKNEKVAINEEFSVTSYNIGFGAYSPEYTFFMDSGYDKDGNPVSGYYGKGISYDDVMKNTKGSASTLLGLDSDFYLLQEVDIDSDRAYHINQEEIMQTSFSSFDSTTAVDYDSAYLFYPFYDPHGKSKSSLLTLSSYAISSANRKEYVISTDFSKFFDLDRCFSVNRIKVENDKELVLINSHMSAYDEGGIIRNAQLKQLNEYMVEEAKKGNYVICGGDFNHDLVTNNPDYNYDRTNFAYSTMVEQRKPDWLSYMFDENNESSFDTLLKIYADDSEPSCRDCDVVWERGSTFVSTVDGFIVSNNVSVSSVKTTKVGDDGFAYSDHQPTTLKFKLVG